MQKFKADCFFGRLGQPLNFFIRMPWTYVPCSAKSNEKRLYENDKMFYRNFRKY